IAAVNGFALGGGCELALACDIRLASEKAVFGQPEVALGITPGFGGTQRLARLVGSGVASELVFSGVNIDAGRALAIGLANAVYPASELLDAAAKLAARIAAQAPIAVRAAKAALRAGLETDIDSGLALEAEAFASCFGTADQQEGMAAFLEKRKAAGFIDA
ncbi:MAG: enoyl-CoA hydratase/isomerase family protein, partial [Propionibacteriaceae bacterium]|nr:enoyl-CoA hydratase/isomerase family protein [Propionibacteriaceae bacterium]